MDDNWIAANFRLANTLRKIAAQNDAEARHYEREAREWRSDVIAQIAANSRASAAKYRGLVREYLNSIRGWRTSV
jgi:hypothetical protein